MVPMVLSAIRVIPFFSTKSSLTQRKTYLSKNLLVDIKEKAGPSLDKKFAYLICDIIQSCLFSLFPTGNIFQIL